MAHQYLAMLAMVMLAGGAAIAQDRLPSLEPAFDVASVKPNPNADVAEGISVRLDGSARFTGFRVRTLITMAYRSEGIQRFDQLVGAPSWIGVDRFDIVATTRADAGALGGPRLSLAIRLERSWQQVASADST